MAITIRTGRWALTRILADGALAFMGQWELEGGTDPIKARKALVLVFQFESPSALDRVMDVWQLRLKAA